MRQAARSLAADALEKRCPLGRPASISVRASLSVTVERLAHTSGGDHGSTVWTSSPLGYSGVPFSSLTPTSLNHVAFMALGAMLTFLAVVRSVNGNVALDGYLGHEVADEIHCCVVVLLEAMGLYEGIEAEEV